MMAQPPTPAPAWARSWLIAAGIYNLVWGAVTIAFPNLLFDLTGIARPNYPSIWQCVGMIVGVYGIGYLIAANNPRIHWPIVLVGLLGKIFGPIGFAYSLMDGTFPPAFGLTILTNDLIWWIPFTLILWDAFMNRQLAEPDARSLRRFVKESKLDASAAEVFRFHEQPEALRLLIPPGAPMRVVEPPTSLEVGTRVRLRGRVLGLPLDWVALHTEYDPPHLFADQQIAGPFDFWYHRHHITDDGSGGTILRDEIEYVPPFGWWGRVLGDWFIRRQLKAMFEHRHSVTKTWLREHATVGTPA